MNAAAAHLAINNLPPIVNVVGICLLVGGLIVRSRAITRAAAVVLLSASMLAVPTYMTGTRAQKIVREIQSVNVPAIEPHQEAALASVVFLVIEGVLALIAALRPRTTLIVFVLIFSIIATFSVFYTASLGTRIHHPEVDVRR